MDLTNDWVAVTRQLRMYAASSNIRDILVMDESVGIYFRFPRDPEEHDDGHDYLYASADFGCVFGEKPRLSLRELVVYFLLSALERNNIQIRDFAAEAASRVPVPPLRQYRNVLPGLAPAPESKKRTRSETWSEQQDHKRGKQARSWTQQETFNGWVLGAHLRLELLRGKSPLPRHVRGTSLDSGFHDGLSKSPDTSPSKVRPSEPSRIVAVTVDAIRQPNVAFVTDGTTRFVAKLFQWSSTTAPEESVQRELDIYDLCASLQGTYIPYLHGVYRVLDPLPQYHCLVMLTEYIGSGSTVEDTLDAANDILDEDEFQAELVRVAKMEESAMLAVRSLHALRVVHGDLEGRNMLLMGDQVVLVDFESATVMGADLCTFNSWRERDLRRVERVFAA